MLDAWNTFLQARDAVFEDGRVARFGDPETELTAASSGSVLADVSHLGLIALAGDDTRDFLQGQLTSDTRALDPATAQWSGYCSPKGRLLANFLMWRREGDIFMQLPPELREPIQKRLSMFVLRAKVALRDAGAEWVRLALSGPQAEAAIKAALGGTPEPIMGAMHTDAGSAMRIGATKFVLALRPEAAPDLWDKLAAHATPVGAPAWDWLRLTAGIPVILPATQDAFVPQMVNLELIGGVSFQKGCYPGQEIVARTQYLGRLKRRLFLAHMEADRAPQPGDDLYTPDLEGQASGQILNVARAPGGGHDMLAVIQSESAKTQPVHWKQADGPLLALRPLPYALPD
jgi:folate-binding protein YgfZ